MKGLHSFIALFFVSFLGIHACSNPDKAPTKPKNAALVAQEKSKVDSFLSRLNGKLPPNSPWMIEVIDLRKGDASVRLFYSKMPKSPAAVERDTGLVAKRILEIFIEDGIKPAQDWASVFVHAYKRIEEKSITGQDQLISFGRTHYDFNEDKLFWEPVKN